jgi:hypothetical protein
MLFCVGKKPPTWGFMRTIYSYHISYQSHIMALQSYYIETTMDHLWIVRFMLFCLPKADG